MGNLFTLKIKKWQKSILILIILQTTEPGQNLTNLLNSDSAAVFSEAKEHSSRGTSSSYNGERVFQTFYHNLCEMMLKI